MNYKVGDKFHGGVEVVKIGDSINGYVCKFDCDTICYISHIVLDALGLLSEPKNGDKVLVRNKGCSWSREEYTYIGKARDGISHIAEPACGLICAWDEVTTKDPNAVNVEEALNALKPLYVRLSDAMENLARLMKASK